MHDDANNIWGSKSKIPIFTNWTSITPQIKYLICYNPNNAIFPHRRNKNWCTCSIYERINSLLREHEIKRQEPSLHLASLQEQHQLYKTASRINFLWRNQTSARGNLFGKRKSEKANSKLSGGWCKTSQLYHWHYSFFSGCPYVAGVVGLQNDNLIQTSWYFLTDSFTYRVQCFKVFNNLTIAMKSQILYPKIQCFTALPRSYSDTRVSAVAWHQILHSGKDRMCFKLNGDYIEK